MVNYRSYALSAFGKVKEQSQKHVVAYRVGGVSGVVAGIMVNPAMTVFAEEVSGGNNLIDADTLAVISSGFSSLVITITALIVMAMTASVTIVGLSQACDYALKRMKAAFKKAG